MKRNPYMSEVRLFERRRKRWIREGHLEQWVAVCGSEPLGFFASPFDAWWAGVDHWGIDGFLVKQVLHEYPPERIGPFATIIYEPPASVRRSRPHSRSDSPGTATHHRTRRRE